MRYTGKDILKYCEGACRKIILISPYVKEMAMARLLNAIPANVPITLISRYLQGDVKSGVCDLSAIEMLWKREAEVLVYPLLHAKIYVIDDFCFVGSANITSQGLGWSNTNNVEILLQTSGLSIILCFRLSDQVRFYLIGEEHTKLEQYLSPVVYSSCPF